MIRLIYDIHTCEAMAHIENMMYEAIKAEGSNSPWVEYLSREVKRVENSAGNVDVEYHTGGRYET